MTDLENVPVKEPEGEIWFGSKARLYEHVIKHPLDGRDERWTQLIDADQLAEARREIREELPEMPMLRKTMRDYSRILSEEIFRLTHEEKDHRHLYWEPIVFSEDGERILSAGLPDGAAQTIEALEIDKKILIIARSFVRNGVFVPYVLCSGYRCFPKLSGNSLRKKMKRHVRERRCLRKGTLLAEHNF